MCICNQVAFADNYGDMTDWLLIFQSEQPWFLAHKQYFLFFIRALHTKHLQGQLTLEKELAVCHQSDYVGLLYWSQLCDDLTLLYWGQLTRHLTLISESTY